MKCYPWITIALMSLTSMALGEPLKIDLTLPQAAPHAIDAGSGTIADPEGHTITADSRSLLFDGKPWVPIMGEFHFSRYPQAEWRDELLKMKAGGITVVATYVFWIHHEEERGKFDWDGQRSLRDFLALCREVGLKAIVRVGPWAHGEVRNGGLPDWVEHSHAKLRSTDPAFMDLVKPFFQQIAAQIGGLLWKDGGPVIGVQLDNECDDLSYLFALKALARSVGMDVPLYTMTGWNGVHIPRGDLLPMFGAYPDGFWGGTAQNYRKGFVFTDIRDDGDLGAQFVSKHPDRSADISCFPYLCCETGGGMMSSYTKRIKIDPQVIAALALVKLGCGNNMPGYYMFHGGINPDAALSNLNEEHPNPMPLKDYDFQAPLGACGEVREQYHLLRQQHLFLSDFGSRLAAMPAMFPERKPSSLEDFSTLRWSVRSDGDAGFLFFNNAEPAVPLPDHPGVQFAMQTSSGQLLVPAAPTTIPSGSFGIWPINMDCDGVKVQYATAQPLCRVFDGAAIWYFFAAINGIAPEFAFRSKLTPHVAGSARVEATADILSVQNLIPSADCAMRFDRSDGGSVNFVLLSSEQASQLWRAHFAGRDRVVLSKATVFADNGELRLQSENPSDLTAAIFPPVRGLAVDGTMIDGVSEGIFQKYPLRAKADPAELTASANLVRPARDSPPDEHKPSEADWANAAEWSVQVNPAAVHGRAILQISYTADALRIYAGGKLIDDNYYNGDAFNLALWRLSPEELHSLRLKVLPFSQKLLARLPESVRVQLETAEANATRNAVTVTVHRQVELRVHCTPLQ